MTDALLMALVTAAYGALHSWLASTAFKQRVRGQLGPGVDRAYRLVFNAIASLSSLPIVALFIWRPGLLLYRLEAPWAWIALAGQVLCALLLGLGFLQSDPGAFLGLRQWTDQRQDTPPLVVHGLYHWVRHPLYTAGLMLIWLTPVMTTSVLAFNLVLTAYVLVGSRLEERRLVAEYGEAYRQYQRHVPSLLPLRLPVHR